LELMSDGVAEAAPPAAARRTSARRSPPLVSAELDGMERRRAQPSPAVTLGPPCGLIGGHVGEVMHFLTGLAEPATLGVAYVCDLRTMEVKTKAVPREPECSVCSGLPLNEPHPSRQLFLDRKRLSSGALLLTGTRERGLCVASVGKDRLKSSMNRSVRTLERDDA
jgi:hypothetical protein